jgi:PPOX class probable F420-dependent enzyme
MGHANGLPSGSGVEKHAVTRYEAVASASENAAMPKPIPSYPALANAKYVALRTFRRNGNAVDTPIWIGGLEGRLVAFTDRASYKVKRIAADPRAGVAICDKGGHVTSGWVGGRAGLITDPDVERLAYAVLREKYGWRMRLLSFFSWLGRRIRRRAVIEVRLSETTPM